MNAWLGGVAAALLLAAPALAKAPTPRPPLLLYGDEGAAVTDDARALFFNPAGLGVRYPSELAISWARLEPRGEVNTGLWSHGGFGLLARRIKDSSQEYGFGLAGGSELLRLGTTVSWHVDAATHDVARDERVGLLSRPAPWLSLGMSVDHLFQPAFQGRNLSRTYDLGIGLRPLALRRATAHTLGTRLTLSGDLVMPDDGDFSQARVRIGAELELLPGLLLRGGVEDHGAAHFALGIRGPRWGLHAQRATVDGHDRYDTWNVSLHSGDEPTLVSGRAEQRVAVVRAAGHLGDDQLAGMTLLGPVGSVSSAGLHQQLERALEDPYTRGVLLDLRGVSNMAQIEELRLRIQRLREHGKHVVAWLEEGGGRGDLYLASACDRIVTSPEAVWVGLGLRSERRYYRGLLADLGLRLDRTSYGVYKSAYRNFSVDSTSPADREVIEHNLDLTQEMFVATVAADRHMDRARLLTLLDGRWWPSTELAKAGLVDAVGYREDAVRILGDLCGLGAKPRAVNLARTASARRAWTLPTRIAVIYATGAIDVGRSGGDLLMGPFMGSATVSRQIEQAFRQRSVRAVVLRVESPGGSSLGSDLIDHALVKMKRETKKPLIVSMGGVAASGGYLISMHGDRLFADRFTYTGSIGVLTVKPSLEGFYRKHGVRQDEFERGAYMRGLSQGRDWDAQIQASADSGTVADYRRFVGHVAEARGLAFDQVEPNAQGRVWLAEDARERKLVDEIGGLEAALAEARRRAGIPAAEKIRLAEYRRPSPSLIERLVMPVIRDAWDRNAHLPEPGEQLMWTDDQAP